ncbi:hypothetical protein PAHAL_3G467100 [Panicum hallii]|uniref:Uncharacterized protein n=1 Tax=Panicum hallii TaxID=206008 RepID=A0A2S3HF00_9POAL|nr:hypothetical protein PAHAL_3G467100 [Panicum hallii]
MPRLTHRYHGQHREAAPPGGRRDRVHGEQHPRRARARAAGPVGLRRLGVSMASRVRTSAPSPPPHVADVRVLEHGAEDVARREHGLRDLPAELLPGAAPVVSASI